jgi:hypothetical protein
MRWFLTEKVLHTSNFECGRVCIVCIGIMSQNLEFCDPFFKLVLLSRIYMLILRNDH